MSSTLTTEMSSGTLRPASCRARMRPNAISSLLTKTAVASGIAAMVRPARYPDSGVQSAGITGGGTMPRSRSVCSQASLRCCVSVQ